MNAVHSGVAGLTIVALLWGVAIAQERKPRPKTITGELMVINDVSIMLKLRGYRPERTRTFYVSSDTEVFVESPKETEEVKDRQGKTQTRPKQIPSSITALRQGQRAEVYYVDDNAVKIVALTASEKAEVRRQK